MTRLRVLTVIDQTEQDLLRRIQRGEWKEHLPPFKQLASLLGISVPTLGRAIKRLTRRGVLISLGPRRPFKIAAEALAEAPGKSAPADYPPVAKGRLLLVLPRSLDYFYGWPAALFLELSLTMVREGWHFDIALVDPSKPPVALRALDRLVARHKPTHVLLANTPLAYCEWARRTTAPSVAFLGGEPEAAGEVPIIGANAELPARMILEKFRALGHRKVLLALGNMQARTVERFVKAHKDVFGGDRGQMEADHLLFAVNAPLASLEEKQVIKDALRRSGATAVLSTGVARYFLLLEAARELDLQIPRDLSIALMSQDTVFKDLPLIPAHVKAPPQLFIREVHVWLRSRRPDTYALASRLMRHWEPGDTMAKAPR